LTLTETVPGVEPPPEAMEAASHVPPAGVVTAVPMV
jgi:hypothetical protein